MKWNWKKKWAPTGRRMITLLIGLLVIDLGLLTYLTRKPACLENSLFNELEWTFENGEKVNIFRCESNVQLPLNQFIIENLSKIQRRLDQIESSFKTNFIPKKPMKLTIHEGDSEVVQSSSETVVMSEKMFFDKTSILEKGYLKSWLQQFQKGQGLGLLRLDVLTQFLFWNFGTRNKNQYQWQVILGQWPHFATSWGGYCKSEIKDPMYEPLCASSSLTKKSEKFTPFSMNFWMGQKLWESFQILTVGNQLEFLQKIGVFVENLSESELIPLNEMTLEELEAFARKESEFWKFAIERTGFHDMAWSFSNKILSDLDSYKSSLSRVDLLVRKIGSWTTQELDELRILSLEETNYRIMAENSEGIWSFPWLVPISEEAYPNLVAQNLILIVCEWPKVEEILNYEKKSDKIVIVQRCNDNQSSLVFSGLLHRGLQFFSLDNKDEKFITVNIEGLRFLIGRDETLRHKSLVIFPQTQDRKNYLATKSNWSSALWNQKFRAYEVQATIDVVEWFKLPDNVWPDFQ